MKGPWRAVLYHLTADIYQPAVANPGGAGGLAGTASQAAIQVPPGCLRNGLAFQTFLDEVNTSPRPVQLVPQQLIGWTGRGAESAMHAFAQNAVGFAALGGVVDEIGQVGLHVCLY
jgi:hypothetical protein